jgi:hypothetical protein
MLQVGLWDQPTIDLPYPFHTYVLADLALHVAIGIDQRPGSIHSAPLAREYIAWEDHQCSSLPAS